MHTQTLEMLDTASDREEEEPLLTTYTEDDLRRLNQLDRQQHDGQ